MAYNETFVLEGVFAVSTPGCCPCVQRTDPDQEDEEEESHSPPFPGDPSVFAVPAAGLNVDLPSAHPYLHMGTWVCVSCELRGGTD